MRTREKVMFTRLLNPALVGATKFFDSTAGINKRNHLTGTSLDNAGLEAAKTLIRKMKSTEGNPTMIQPDFILTSVALEETAMNLLNKTTIQIQDENNAADTPNSNFRVWEQFRGRFGHEASPWLDTNSSVVGALDSTWFLLGDKSNGGAMEYAQLAGMQAPMMNMDDTDFSTWGFQSRVIWAWGFTELLNEAIVRVDA